MPTPRLFPILSCVCASMVSLSASAAEIKKANNTTNLINGASWIGGNFPESDDIAVWDATVTGANTSSMGGSWSASGLRIDDAGGTATIFGTATTQILSLGADGIEVNGADLSFSTSGTINLTAAQTWSVSSGRTLSFNNGWSVMTGSADLAINGPGSVVLGTGSGARVYTFGSGSVSLGGGIRLINDAPSLSNHTRTVTNATTLSGNITLQANAAGSGNNVSSFIFSGGLNAGSTQRIITLSLPNLTDTTTYGAANGSRTVLDLTVANALTGTGTVYFQNESTDADKTAHVRVLNIANAIAVPDIRIGANVYLMLQGTSADIGANTSLTIDTNGVLGIQNASSGGGVRTIKSLSGSGTVDNFTTNGGAATLVIDGGAGTGGTQFSGVIRDSGTGTTALTKKGTTTQVLSGANTYRGATTIDGGTLLVNGTHIQSATGLLYTVNSGGILGGAGRIALSRTVNANMITVNSGGFLAPGDTGSLGTFTLDGGGLTGATNKHLVMNTGSEFSFDVAGNGSDADVLAFWNYTAGDITLNNNKVNLSLLGEQQSGTYTVSLFRFFSDTGLTTTTSSISSGLVAGLLGEGISNVSFAYNGSTIDLTYTVTASMIPEPSTASAILGGLVLLAALGRRRRAA